MLDSDDWLKLPGRFEIHEWGIMSDFAGTLESEAQYAQVRDAMRGRGAFRQFKDTVRRLDIEDKWFAFKRQALERIALEWLAVNGLDVESP